MKNIFICKSKDNKEINNILINIKKSISGGFKIKKVSRKEFFRNLSVKPSDNLFIDYHSISKNYLKQLSQLNVIKDKGIKILIAKNGYKDIDTIYNLFVEHCRFSDESFRNFNYLIFKIDPYFSKEYAKRIERIRNYYGNLIFLGFKDKSLTKKGCYVDVNFKNRLPKFLKNIILFKDIKLSSPSYFPTKAMIEPIRGCNLKCPSCPMGSGKAKNFTKLSIDDYKKIIDKIYTTVDDLSLFNYGEPLLHRDIDQMITYAKKKGVAKVKIHTNGMLLTEQVSNRIIKSGLDNISVSIDGASKESYSQYRVGGNFDLLVSNIINFLRIRKRLKSAKPSVRVQFVIMRHNEHEIDKFYKMFKKIGVDEIRYKTFNAHMDGSSNLENLKLLSLNKKYTRYLDNSAKKISKRFKKSICNWPWDHLVVNSNGDIAPCCYDYNANYRLGSIFDKNWWNNIARFQFRKAMVSGSPNIKMCQFCAIGIPDLSYKKIKL